SYPVAKLANELDLIHFCGITLAMNDQVRGQIKQLASAVKEQKGLVTFDCNYRPSLWGEEGYRKARPHYEAMLHLSDIVMMNEQDAVHILNMDTTKHQRSEQLE